MIDKIALINGIAEKAGQILGGEKSQTREDIERNIKALVSSALSRLDLVSRDEFDAKAAVLEQTRMKLEALEKHVAQLQYNHAEQVVKDAPDTIERS
ncbi:MAG: accessory factor UbiK family protein [Endozoicomonas sp. (ex Botrylloides leachii)]|nr:accessory factor UbiK family protein [Endozoicomonas sp. (ex Botrylloides leachii)]